MTATPTPTDSLLRRVTRAIERRRALIDGGLSRVEIIVRFDDRTGYPTDLEYRSAEHDRGHGD